MRKTPVLYKVHVGRMIKKHWFYQGKLKIGPGNAEKYLKQLNAKVYKIEDLEPPKEEAPKIVDSLIPEELPLDENHPDWKSTPCYIYRDEDALVEGLEQAKVLANAEEICGLPFSLSNLENKIDLPDYIYEEAKRKIMQSCIFDAFQEKLPKRHDPNRPGFNFRRDYGITDVRKNKLLIYNLAQLCEQHFHSENKSLMHDAFFSYPMKACNKSIQLEMTADLLIRSKEAISLVSNEEENLERKPIIDMHPLDCTITLKPYHFYNMQLLSPVVGSKWPYIHTLFISYNKTQVSNIYGEPVLESQIIGRNLLKGFSAACTQACHFFGRDVKNLIIPVVVQIIMTDGKMFHFSVLQLNTLDTENKDGLKNVYWNPPAIPVYDRCEYFNGTPVLEGYNPKVINRIFAFYTNK